MDANWIDWETASARVRANALDEFGLPRILADWARAGIVATRAKTMMVNSAASVNAPIPVKVWKDAVERGIVDYANGYLQSQTSLNGLRAPSSKVVARGIEFLADQLNDLAPAVAEKAQSERVSSDRQSLGGGRRADMERWKRFYFAAVELAKEGCLDGEHFGSARALGEELLDRMGEGAFDFDYVKATVGQLHRKFCGG